MNTKNLIRGVAAVVIAGAACAAHAGPVLTQNGFANAGTAASVTTGGGPNNGTHDAGEFSGVFGGASFLSYCVDLSQFFSVGTAYTDYTVLTGIAAFGATKATQIGELLTAAGGFALSSPGRSAAVQAGLWEILYETGPSLALDAGSFTAVGGSVGTSDLAIVNGYLRHLDHYASTAFTVLASPTSQDFITADPRLGGTVTTTAVPEPSSAALAVLALGGAAFARRRRA